MDIKCRICGEPWDADCLHDEVAYKYPDKPWNTEIEPETKDVYTRLDNKTGKWYNHQIYLPLYEEVRKDFSQRGCEALNASHNERTINKDKNDIYGQILDMFDADIDAAASGTEDYDTMWRDE
jgi:hypothetical protein